MQNFYETIVKPELDELEELIGLLELQPLHYEVYPSKEERCAHSEYVPTDYGKYCHDCDTVIEEAKYASA